MAAFDAWDQVNECDLEIASGTIVIAGCTDYFSDPIKRCIWLCRL